MGFLSGRVTFARFRVAGPAPGMFGPEHLERLEKLAAGRKSLRSGDGVEVGWTAGDHILDTRFRLEKNVVNESLHFALRVDAQKIPADLLRAYYQIELEGRSARNPSGLPSAKQKRDAKDAAVARIEQEAKDGRFIKRKAVPVMWDARSNELLVGTTAVTPIEQLFSLFERTFECGFEAITAGRLAFHLAELHGQARGVDDASPSPFIPELWPKELAWIPDEDSRDFLGNEFLLWLWHHLDTASDSVAGADKSEITVMLSRTLTLECPRGQTGHETISHEAPARLPEARRAIQAGKLPRKAGLTIVRHDKQYSLTLHAETLAVSGCKMPPAEEGEVGDARARLDARVDQVRHLVETLDLLYDAFIRLRCGSKWDQELAKMQKWLRSEEKRR